MPELVNWTNILLDKISNKYIKRKGIAKTYRLALKSHEGFNTQKVNRAIIDRWSITALQYIKNLAWSKTQRQVVSGYDVNTYSSPINHASSCHSTAYDKLPPFFPGESLEMLNESRPTILCVDDAPKILNILSGILNPEYNVKTTVNCNEALKICSEHEIEVVIADQNMPEMDGTEFLVKANKLNPICKRLLLTSFGETDTVKNAIKFGVVDKLLRKPCDANEIKETVDLLLNDYALHKHKIYTKCLGNSIR